ncbi:MAG: SDR family oxidoreductase [Anaerolineales bacterium]
MREKASARFGLDDRTAVITGGAGLLGREFARTLAEAGAKVAIAERNPAAAAEVVASLAQSGAVAVAIETDVTRRESVSAMTDRVLREFGTFDILINCAAIDPKFGASRFGANSGRFEDYPIEAWRGSLEVNLTGAFLACQAAARPMLAQARGVIVNLCSTYGLVGPDQRIYQEPGAPEQFKPPDYSVAKAGLLGLTRYLATYFAGKGIRVNALTPGGVRADQDPGFVQRYSSRTLLGRMANRDELNGALLFLVSDASSYMTGANLVVDGGWTAW